MQKSISLSSGASRLFLSLQMLLGVFAVVVVPAPAASQVIPFIVDGAVTDVMGPGSASGGQSAPDSDVPQRICAFRLSNPDTVPFYLLVSFNEGGKMVHTSRGSDLAAMRLIDLELRYKNGQSVQMVKKFPGSEFDGAASRRNRLFGRRTAESGAGRFGKKKPHEKVGGEDEGEGGRRYRTGVYEIPFWQEDAQGYYEMEVWGTLYVRGADGRVVAGRYVETINIDIEGMEASNGTLKRRKK